MGYGKVRFGRKSQRDRLIENKNGIDFWAAATDKPSPVEVVIPPKRNRVTRPVDKRPVNPLEKDVLAEALEALRADPRVAFVDRRQSGLFMDGERYIRIGTPGTLDVSGMLVGGRYFELEAKRPGERPDEKQQRRIALVRDGGGISGYFTSALEALAFLP